MRLMVKQDGGRYVIGYCHAYTVDSIFHDSMLGLAMMHPQDFAGVISTESATYLAWARNLIAGRFLDETKAEYLLFIDTDQSFKPNLFEALVRHADENTIVGARYFGFNRRNRAVSPMFNDMDMKPWDNHHDNALLEVGAMGTGCMLIHREILKTVPPPWFHYREDGLTIMGEDFAFCVKAREHGVRLLVDTSITLPHAKGILIDENDVRRRAPHVIPPEPKLPA